VGLRAEGSGVGFRVQDLDEDVGDRTAVMSKCEHWRRKNTSTQLYVRYSMTKCLRPHHDFDDFTTYDLTTLRLVIDLETHFCTVNLVSRSITSRKVVKVVRS